MDRQHTVSETDISESIHSGIIFLFVFRALESLSLLGGEDLEPFYAMLDGGREGEFFAELEEYFYYAQIRR